MNSIKLPPIVQESIFSNGLISDDTDEISFLPGTLLLNSSMPDFTQTEKPEEYRFSKEELILMIIVVFFVLYVINLYLIMEIFLQVSNIFL